MNLRNLMAMAMAGFMMIAMTNMAKADPAEKIGNDVDAIAQSAGNLVKWILDRPQWVSNFVADEVEKTKQYQKEQWTESKFQLKGFFENFPKE
tara:strand:+ start:416 stop:694 length:279 start_codon:yes stop_codon:yes gene_type:complete